MVILTRNEADHVGDCLASLAEQTCRAFEVVLVDAASTDDTLDVVEAARESLPVPLTVEASRTRLPIGRARNLGVERARAPNVAFVSADTELEERWVGRALAALDEADVVYGRQVHAVGADTPAAAVRTLRYHFPSTPTDEPRRYASNAAAAYRRGILERFPLREGEDVVDDLLVGLRAARAGARIAYDPDMVVHHHDVHRASEEWTKNAREGEAWGRHVRELGLHTPVLAWGLVLAGAAALAATNPLVGTGALAVALWVPALRRAARRRRELPPAALLQGVAASPPFDLAFLWHYLRGLAAHAIDRATGTDDRETRA